MDEEPKYPNVRVRLSGEDGNVFAIMGRVKNALRKAGIPADETDKFLDEMLAQHNYYDALNVVMRWVRVA